ncbi:MAG: hypothetical protein HHJ11_11540 [Phycicoccus sp.]|nr:hypothetical protein [Phycicoccus sp.]NMM33218.1 hypothetical protein [Phycicoccus sp.]
MSSSAKGLAVAGVYGGSVGLLFLADTILSAHVSPAEFGEYTLTRNALPLVLTLGLFGVDQALIRALATGPATGLLRPVVGQRLFRVALVGLVAGVVLRLLGAEWRSSLALFACALAVCISELVSAALRGQGSYIASSILQQGYRLVLASLLIVGVVAFGVYSYTYVVLSLLFACTVVGVLAALKVRPMWQESPDRENRRALNRLAGGFGLSMLSFAVLDWLDQAMVTLLSTDLAATGVYNIHKLWGVYPLLSIASIGGFLLMPELVRSRDSLTLARLRKFYLAAGLLALALAAAAFTVSALFLPHIVRLPVDTGLLALFVIIGAVRLFNLVPSAALGAVGTDALIRKASKVGLLPIVIMPAIAATLSIAIDVKVAVAAALLVATVMRTGISVGAAWKAVEGRIDPRPGDVDDRVLTPNETGPIT